MSRWTCPQCEREFGRARQSHVCVPGSTVDHSFGGRAARWRPIYDAIAAHVTALGPVHQDAVQVGVFLKHRKTFAEVRPKARSLHLWLMLSRPLHDDRISRRMPVAAGRFAHVVKLTTAADVDDQVRDWLTEAYDDAG
ncbi:MAG TPA: DUF5655 domain-containing protein [Actinoplanes sp.]|nr:DUF5655 domain-containing protein [Actinoplanes sp.]